MSTARYLAAALGVLLLAASGATAQDIAEDGPEYVADGSLRRPSNYREWVYLTSGLGMTYGPAGQTEGRAPMFDNVFVTRAAYRDFMRTGRWPEKTMLVLEIRSAEEQVSINNGGRTQGRVVAIEVALKDSAKFRQTTWAYFDFSAGTTAKPTAQALPATARCYACHGEHAAVENTFVQFYPELMEVAKRLGTVNRGYDPARKVAP
jgi:hypothetical protein